MKICPKCNIENKDDYRFCINCGFEFQETKSQETKFKEAKFQESKFKESKFEEAGFQESKSQESKSNEDNLKIDEDKSNLSFKICPDCGEKNYKDAIYCKSCGYDLRLLERKLKKDNKIIYKESNIQNENNRVINTNTINSKIIENNFELPDEYKKKFHWGAAFLPFIWPFFYRQSLLGLTVVLSFLICPVFPIIISLYLGTNGYILAYEGRKYNNLQEFIQDQDRWNKGGVIFFIISLIIFIAIFLLIFIFFYKIFKY